jgi:hypothetical protein
MITASFRDLEEAPSAGAALVMVQPARGAGAPYHAASPRKPRAHAPGRAPGAVEGA